MHHKRHGDFGQQSPAAARFRDRRIDMGNDRYLMSWSRRSLSPPRRVERGRRSNSLEMRDYGWDLLARRGDRMRSRSPLLEQVRRRPNYGDSPVAGMHQRYEFYEGMDKIAADDNAGLTEEYRNIHKTSRVIRPDIDGILGQNSKDLEDGNGRGMYRFPTDTGPPLKNIDAAGGNISSLTSVNMGVGRLKDERVPYLDPLLSEKFSLMEQFKRQNPMFHLRDASYSTMPASQSMDFAGTSQFKDFASTSVGNSRISFPTSYRDAMPLPIDEYFMGSVKGPEHMDFAGYRERRVLEPGRGPEAERKELTYNRMEPFSPTKTEHRDYVYNRPVVGEIDYLHTGNGPKAESKNLTSYKRDTFSPTRTSRRDYLYPQPGVVETDLSDDMFRRMSDRIDHDSRPNMVGHVTDRLDTTEFSRRNMISSTLWDRRSVERQTFSDHDDMGRSSFVRKESGQYLDSVSAHAEFGRKVLIEEQIPYLADPRDRDIMLPMISNYSLERDAGPVYHNERSRRSTEFQHEAEMRSLSVRSQGIKGEEYDKYTPSNRVPKRKQSADEEMNWHDSRNVASSRTQVQDEREEWIVERKRSSFVSKRAAHDYDTSRRKERTFDRTERRKLSAYDDRSYHEPDEHFPEHSRKPHKSGDKYSKGDIKRGSQNWYNSYHYNKDRVLHKPRNVWIRGKDDNRADLHVDEVEQSTKLGNSAKDELAVDSEEFKKLVHDYFLFFTRKLNDNFSARKRYKEQGRAGSLFCIVCGRSLSKDFTDTQRLVTHAFMSHKPGLRAQHLGYHKAICVLLGWNTVVAPDVVTWLPEKLSDAEALAQKEDLIIWPPVIVIHNSSTSGHNSERQKGTTVEAVEEFLRGVSGGKVKTVNHSIMVVKFLGTFSGLQDAEKLHKYFAENKHGRKEFGKIASSKGKNSRSTEGKAGGKLDELKLFGYMGIAEDLDQVDFDTKRKCSIKSKKEIQDLVDAPVKPESEDKK